MATLLEIVCEHVKAWPNGASHIYQDNIGNLCWGDAYDESWGVLLSVKPTASDGAETVIAREQWEHAVLAKTTSVQCDAELPIGMVEDMHRNCGGVVQADRHLHTGDTKESLNTGFAFATGRFRCDTKMLTAGFELSDGAQAHIPRTEYELLLASRQAWLHVMQALDETHPDWATGTTQGTLVERAVKAIKNGN